MIPAKPRTFYGLNFHHFIVFFLTFSGYAFYHATRKTFSNVKTTIAMEWTPTPQNSCFPEPHTYLKWNSRQMFSSLNQATYYLGGLDTAFMISYATGLYISGYIGDRFNLRNVLTVGMCLSALTVFFFGTVSEWLHIYSPAYYMAFWILNGLLQSTGWPSMLAVMGNWFPKSSRGLVLGLWSANASVGNIVGALIAAAVLPYGYEYAFMVPSLMLFGWGIVTFFCLVPSPKDIGLPEPEEDITGSSSRPNVHVHDEIEPLLSNEQTTNSGLIQPQYDTHESIVKQGSSEEGEMGEAPADANHEKQEVLTFCQAIFLPGVIMYSLSYASLKLVNYAFFFWLPFYLTTNFGWSQSTADSLSIWFDVGGIISSTIAGLISDCMGKRAPIVSLMIVLSFPAIYIYSVSPANKTINIILLTITGAFVGGPSNMIGTAITADLGRQSRLRGNKQALATVTGIVDGTGSVGAAIGQLLIPIFKINLGWQYVFYFFIAMMFCTLLCILPMLYHELCQSCRQRQQSAGNTSH